MMMHCMHDDAFMMHALQTSAYYIHRCYPPPKLIIAFYQYVPIVNRPSI